jgi:superfamily II DNA or RNA helicase
MSNGIELKHPFVNKCPDVDALLKKEDGQVIQSIESLCAKIKQQAELHMNLLDPNDYKGWALELFVEYLIKVDGRDNRIGIYDYQVVSEGDADDVGVDGHGMGDNSYPTTVQVKFRRGDYVLTANNDHLSNFLTSSWADYLVPMECDKNMLIITTGMKVDEQSREKMLKNKVRVLNRDALREMCDNRPEFWTRFYESVRDSRVKVACVTPITLREHQVEAADAIVKDENSKGKVILPTGTGKTIIEAETIRRKILECQEKGISPVIKVNASRILLCFQLFEDVFRYLNSHGMVARYMNFNSGNADEKYYAIMLRKSGGVFREIVSTTSAKAAKEQFNKAQTEKMPLIVFSTYNSSVRFSQSGIVPDLTIHDEAHNLVSREFSAAAILPSKADFYFTATERTTESGLDLGMNNESIFDKTIYQKSAKEMMEKGEMVQPRIHIVKGKGKRVDVEKTDADYEILFSSITASFFAHSRQIKADSYSADKIGAKVLVVCRGQQDLMEMFKTGEFAAFRLLYPNVHIFALSSEFGMMNDGEMYKPPVTNMKKYKMLKKLKELRSEEEAIIFHVDMIGEGIDVPGITGVMPFRNCEMGKFVQNIGRAARLHGDDRKRFYAGEISPCDLTKYIKPYSWVIIPTFLVNSEGFADRFRGIVERLRGEYGITKENVLISNEHGLTDDELIDTVNDPKKDRPWKTSGITEFSHEFEEMSCIERIIFEEEVSVAKEKALEDLRNIVKNA